jgi:hypothetical protein
MIRAGSQNDRVLAVLADGLPHSAAEIHRRAGFSRLNSRVAELRSKEGLRIVCEHVGGTGSEAFHYTLLPEPAEKTLEREQSSESAFAGARTDAGSGSSDNRSGGEAAHREARRASPKSGCPLHPAQSPATASQARPPAVAGAQLDLFGAAA